MLHKKDLHLLIDEEIYAINPPKTLKPTPLVQKKNTHKEEPTQTLTYGFFHNNEGENELELLDKIIAACKLPDNQYQVFNNSSRVTSCTKAVIFTNKPKAYYQWIPFNKHTSIMYALSLQQIAHSKIEKTKLWKALQEMQ